MPVRPTLEVQVEGNGGYYNSLKGVAKDAPFKNLENLKSNLSK
jgi:hypothetical protein